MSHLSHPIKAKKVTILNFADSRQTEVHAAGCAHEAKAVQVYAMDPAPSADDGYGDDWYKVAPCARKGAR